jgi:hypothetical protein
VHDAKIFSKSDLFAIGTDGLLFPDQTRLINGFNLPIVLVGDPAYPLLPWVMKAYPEYAGMSQKQRNINYRLSKAQITVEHAFGRLKGRWRCLLKRMDYHLSNVPHVVATCVVLHNVCESLGGRWGNENRHDEVSLVCRYSNQPCHLRYLCRLSLFIVSTI